MGHGSDFQQGSEQPALPDLEDPRWRRGTTCGFGGSRLYQLMQVLRNTPAMGRFLVRRRGCRTVQVNQAKSAIDLKCSKSWTGTGDRRVGRELEGDPARLPACGSTSPGLPATKAGTPRGQRFPAAFFVPRWSRNRGAQGESLSFFFLIGFIDFENNPRPSRGWQHHVLRAGERRGRGSTPLAVPRCSCSGKPCAEPGAPS